MGYAFPTMLFGKVFACDPCLVVAFRPGLVVVVHGGLCGGCGCGCVLVVAAINKATIELQIDASVQVDGEVLVIEVVDKVSFCPVRDIFGDALRGFCEYPKRLHTQTGRAWIDWAPRYLGNDMPKT